jgi:tRNA(adenine34) deaminase
LDLDFNEADLNFMREALYDAEKAAVRDEIPVGSLIVYDNKIITRACNLKETVGDPTAHAEMLVIRQASEILGNWRWLTEATLYTTLEPCPMCAGAMVLARIKRLVYGAYDPKAGAAGSLMNLAQHEKLNHRMAVTAGVMEEDCAAILKKFFSERRLKNLL